LQNFKESKTQKQGYLQKITQLLKKNWIGSSSKSQSSSFQLDKRIFENFKKAIIKSLFF